MKQWVREMLDGNQTQSNRDQADGARPNSRISIQVNLPKKRGTKENPSEWMKKRDASEKIDAATVARFKSGDLPRKILDLPGDKQWSPARRLVKAEMLGKKN